MIARLRKLFQDSDKLLLFLSLALCMFGLFNIVNVSSQEATNKLVDESIYFYFYRQLLFVIIGFILSIIIMTRPVKSWNKYLFLMFGAVVFLNLYAIISGSVTRGATNWVELGPISFQPSELSKPVVILCVATLFEQFAKTFQNTKIDHNKQFIIILIAGLAIPLLVFLQKDIGTMSIIGGTFFVMFLFSPINKKEKFKMFKILVILGVVLLFFYMLAKGSILTNAQKGRLDFIDPCSSEKYVGGGYQVCNAFIAINRGNLIGVGIGKSTQKYSYIPEPHTDMVFSIISEEYGFIIGAAIIIIYAIMIWRIIDLATYASTISGRYICLGTATFMFIHIFLNLGGMFGIIPLTGVPLPFLSYGGSFLLALMVSLALVQRVHIDTKRSKIF